MIWSGGKNVTSSDRPSYSILITCFVKESVQILKIFSLPSYKVKKTSKYLMIFLILKSTL